MACAMNLPAFRNDLARAIPVHMPRTTTLARTARNVQRLHVRALARAGHGHTQGVFGMHGRITVSMEDDCWHPGALRYRYLHMRALHCGERRWEIRRYAGSQT